MSIQLQVEPRAIRELVLSGYETKSGILIDGERQRLECWPNNITFGDVQFTCVQVKDSGMTSSNGDGKLAIYRPSRGIG
jgi:hypothetical protein